MNSSFAFFHRALICGIIFMTGALAGCWAQNGVQQTNLIRVSKTHSICSSAASIFVQSTGGGIDYEHGTISTKEGVEVNYYVGEHPDEYLRRSEENISSLSREGIHAARTVYSDDTAAILLAGYVNGIDGVPKVIVKYSFPKKDGRAGRLAKELAESTNYCRSF